jgi:hypothetical protein
VNAKLSQHMTLLGLCAMAFYGLMLGTGQFTLEVLPQFLISALIFLSSGRIMRLMAKRLPAKDEEEVPAAKSRPESPRASAADWPFLTGLLNWTAAGLIVAVMALWLMKPIGVSVAELLQTTRAHDHFFAGAVP